MNRINYRFLAVLLVCSVGVAVGLHALHYVQARRSAHFFLDKARVAQQDGNLPEAVDLFRRYLQLAPNDMDALADYGLTLAEKSKVDRKPEDLRRSLGQAYGVLERVLRSQPDREDEENLRRSLAEVAMHPAMRRYRDALEQLEMPAMVASKDWRLLGMRAVCLERTGQGIAAVRTYDQAIQLAPDQLDVYPEQAKLLRSLAPDQLNAYQKMAKSLGGLNRAEKKDSTEETSDPKKNADRDADRYVETMLEKNPKSARAFALSAAYWYALAVTESVALIGDAKKLIDRAEGDVKQALALAPDGADILADILLLASNVVLKKAQFSGAAEERAVLAKQAEEYAERAVKIAPRNYRCYLVVADIARGTGDPQKALDRLSAGVKELPEETRLLLPTAVFLLDGGRRRMEQAKDIIDSLRKVPEERWPQPEQTSATIDYLQGRLDYLDGKWSVAARELELASAGLIKNEGLLRSAQYWLGASYEQLAAVDKQVIERQLAAYRRAQGRDPTGILAGLGVARTLASIGRLDEAIEEQRNVMRLRGAPPVAWLQLAAWLIQQNRNIDPSAPVWKEASEAVDKAALALPDAPEVRLRLPLLRADILARQGLVKDAEKVLEAARDEAKDAEKVLKEAREKQPDQPTFGKMMEEAAWVALAGLAQQQRDWVRTEQVLGEAKRELGDTVALLIARARYYFIRYEKNEAAPKLLELAKDAEKIPVRDRTQLLSSLAAALLQLDDAKGAMNLCQEAAELKPDNLQIRLLQFEAASRVQDENTMKEAAGEIRKIEGEGPIWHVVTAIGLRMKAQQEGQKERSDLLKEALVSLQKARELNKYWSRVPLIMAEIHRQLGQPREAFARYKEAIDQGERDVAVVRQAVQILYEQSDPGAADQAEVLIRELAGRRYSADSDLMRLTSEVLLRREDLPEALTMAQEAAKDSKDFRDHVWLGQVLMVAAAQDLDFQRNDLAKAKLDEAAKELLHAIELRPTDSTTRILLIRVLTHLGRGDEARRLISEAQKKIPQKELAGVMPLLYEATRNSEGLDKAAELYDAGLAKTPDDLNLRRQAIEFYLKYRQSSRVQDLLKEIVDGRVPTDKTGLFWARRQLALVLRSSNNFQDRKRALGLVDENLKSDPQSVYDRRAKAGILASDPKRAVRQEAIGILEGLMAEKAATPEDYLLLLQLYLPDRDPTKSASGGKDAARPAEDKTARKNWELAKKEIARQLSTSYRNEPRYVEEYVGVLLDGGETSEAALWMGPLERRAPNQPATLKLQAEILFATGKYDEAIARLKAIPGASAGFSDRAALPLSVAGFLKDFAGRLTTPESKADAAKLEQEAQSCLNQALDVAEKAGPKSDPLALANFASRLLGTGEAKGPQLQRLNALLDSAIKEQNRPSPLLLVLADLRTAEQRFDEVEALYGEVLGRDRENVVALNNLAVLLALREKRFDEAAQMMEKAIQRMGPEPTLLDSRAMVAAAGGRPEEALKDLNQAIEDEPRPAPYFHRAWLHLRNGRREAALEDWNNAKQLGLKEGALHPLERGMYAKLRESLK